MVRPVLAQGRVGVRSGPRRVPFGGDGAEWVRVGAGEYTTVSPEGTEIRVTGPYNGTYPGSRNGRYWAFEIDGGYEGSGGEYDPTLAEAKKSAEAKARQYGEPRRQPQESESDVAEFSALPSADRAMLTHAASGEPPRLGRAHPERPAAPYEPSPRVSPEQVERNREGIRRARETLRNPPVDIPLPKGDQGSPMEVPDMGNAMASYESMLDSLPDRAAAALERRQATSGGNPLGNAPDWLDEVLLMIAAGGAATLLAPAVGGAAGGAALLGGAAMLAQ